MDRRPHHARYPNLSYVAQDLQTLELCSWAIGGIGRRGEPASRSTSATRCSARTRSGSISIRGRGSQTSAAVTSRSGRGSTGRSPRCSPARPASCSPTTRGPWSSPATSASRTARSRRSRRTSTPRTCTPRPTSRSSTPGTGTLRHLRRVPGPARARPRVPARRRRRRVGGPGRRDLVPGTGHGRPRSGGAAAARDAHPSCTVSGPQGCPGNSSVRRLRARVITSTARLTGRRPASSSAAGPTEGQD